MKEYLVISIKDNVLTYDFKFIDESLSKFVNKNEFNNNTLYYSISVPNDNALQSLSLAI